MSSVFSHLWDSERKGGAKSKSEAAMGKGGGLGIREGSGWGEYDGRRLCACYS